jgi:hypothetical protein
MDENEFLRTRRALTILEDFDGRRVHIVESAAGLLKMLA